MFNKKSENMSDDQTPRDMKGFTIIAAICAAIVLAITFAPPAADAICRWIAPLIGITFGT